MAKTYLESEIFFKEHLKDPRFIDRTGHKSGGLTVLGFGGQTKVGQSLWYCRCDCLKITLVHGSALTKSHTSSCGCLQIEKTKERSTTHGHSKYGHCTSEYNAWAGMMARTQNPKNPAYHNYGGRGISVCNRWKDSFARFLEDMGERPKGKTLDRYPDKNGDYCPENCRCSNWFEQANNRRGNRLITYAGKTQNVGQWAYELGMNRGTISKRLNSGWATEKALKPPPLRLLPFEVRGAARLAVPGRSRIISMNYPKGTQKKRIFRDKINKSGL